MSLLDEIFVDNCEDILTYGSSDEGLPVRAKWPDGTPAHTKMGFNFYNNYYLTPTEIPIMTLRKCNFKACVDEILWIYQKTSNNIHDLNSHIWDAWADEEGSIGKAYGYQIRRLSRHHQYTQGEDLSDYPSAIVTDPILDEGRWVWLNQIDGVIWSLRNNPTDRGIIMNMYNHQDLAEMALRPCAYSLTFNVEHRSDGHKFLHALLNQRSQDMVTANGWNVTQYAVLVQMIAQVCGMEARSLTHVIANAHIYDRHEEIAKILIDRYNRGKTKPSPVFHIDKTIKSFKDFTTDSVWLENYQYCEDPLPKIEVAV